MNIPTLPVNLFPLSGSAAKVGGFVVAVLIGLAIYAANQAKKQPTGR
jgi:hypothetical protein